MADGRTFRLRVRFAKRERCVMLSHLEVARALERTVRRAGLPYAVSQGFSPHMKIAFGSALPVGVGGEGECFDLQLTEYRAPEKAFEALQRSSAEGMMVLSCEYIDPKAPAASAAYPYSTYEVRFSEDPGELVVPETVTVVRKKKEKELAVSDFLIGRFTQDERLAWFTLESKPTGSLRPDALLAAMLENAPGVRIVYLSRVNQFASLAPEGR